MYAVTSMLLDKRTRAYLRSAEFGFLGVSVPTRVHTPRFCGAFWFVNFFLKLLYPLLRAGEAVFFGLFTRPLRTSCLIVGIYLSSLLAFNLLNYLLILSLRLTRQ